MEKQQHTEVQSKGIRERDVKIKSDAGELILNLFPAASTLSEHLLCKL